MSDQEYDSTDSSVALEGEESAGAGLGTVSEEPSDPLEGPPADMDESSAENDEEEEEKERGSYIELSESEEPGKDGSEYGDEVGKEREGEGEEGEGEVGEGEGEEGGVELVSSEEEIEEALETTEASVAVSHEKSTSGVESGAFLDSDVSEDEGEEQEGGRGGAVEEGEREDVGGEGWKGEEEGRGREGEGEEEEEEEEEGGRAEGTGESAGADVSTVSAGRRKFLDESDDDDETMMRPKPQSPEQQSTSYSFNPDVFGGSEDEDEGEGVGAKKRTRSWSSPAREGESDREDDEESGVKRLREGSGSGDEEELQQELDDLKEEREREGKGEGEEGEGEEGKEVPEVGGERVVGQREEEETVSDDEPGPSNAGMSDWDIMMQRRKEAMARARKRKKRDIDIDVDDHIMALLTEMKQAVQEDRQLNQASQPALKKLKLLPTVMLNLKKSDLQTTFIECGILKSLAEWLRPLPDHSLPHLKIRESILDILKSYPVPESSFLKTSGIGKALMTLYKHPKETRKNKEKAGKIINEWARPIFGLASDFKSLGRDEREERDYANLHQATKRRLSSSSDPKKSSHEEEYEPAKPGDKGWIGRARVPMPSTRDYVVRPKWKAEREFKSGPSKKVMNRYEKQQNKERQRKMQHKTSHAVSISVEGRKMAL